MQKTKKTSILEIAMNCLKVLNDLNPKDAPALESDDDVLWEFDLKKLPQCEEGDAEFDLADYLEQVLEFLNNPVARYEKH